jgi:tetratricopeptide (TPR) repeat protein
LNENDLAQRYANEAIAADPLEEWGHRLRSIVLLREGRKRESLEAAQEAVRLAPREPLALYSLAQSQRANRMIREARQTAERQREIAPDDALAYESLALLAIDEERYDEAEFHCRKALELNPNSYAAMNNLGLAFLRRNRKHEALEHFHQAARLNPTGKVAHDNLRYTISRHFARFPKFRASFFLYFYLIMAFGRLSIAFPAVAGIVVVFVVGILLAIQYYRMRQLSPEVRSFVSEAQRRERKRAVLRFLFGALHVIAVLVIVICFFTGLFSVILWLKTKGLRAFDHVFFASFCWIGATLLWKFAIPRLKQLKQQQEEG